MKRTLFKTRPLSPAERKRQENAAIVLAAAFRGKNAAQETKPGKENARARERNRKATNRKGIHSLARA